MADDIYIDSALLKLLVKEFEEELSRELTFQELKILQGLATKEKSKSASR